MQQSVMTEMARLIRAGLAFKGVEEDRDTFGACREDSNSPVSANVVGLALIGKVGIARAVHLFEGALEELGQEPGPVTKEVNTLLGIGMEEEDFMFLESMVVRHSEVSAEVVAGELEKGTFKVS